MSKVKSKPRSRKSSRKVITLTIKDYTKEDHQDFRNKMGSLESKWTDGDFTDFPHEREIIYRNLTLRQIKRISDIAQETLPNHHIRVWK